MKFRNHEYFVIRSQFQLQLTTEADVYCRIFTTKTFVKIHFFWKKVINEDCLPVAGFAAGFFSRAPSAEKKNTRIGCKSDITQHSIKTSFRLAGPFAAPTSDNVRRHCQQLPGNHIRSSKH
jgi:hypothetical protein